MDTDFFEHHSLKFLEMAFRTDRIEKIDNPDGYGSRTGDCGDTVEFFLTCKKDTIASASFVVDGCMHTTACSNTVAEFVEGKNIDDAWEVTPEQVRDFLETLPEDHFHCAQLAVGALYLALSDLKNGSYKYKRR